MINIPNGINKPTKLLIFLNCYPFNKNHDSHFIELFMSRTDQQENGRTLTLESILSGIHYFRCHDYIELIAVIHTLPKFLADHKNVGHGRCWAFSLVFEKWLDYLF